MTKNILIISPLPTHPQSAGNSARIYSLISTIISMPNTNVHFINSGTDRGDEFAMKEWLGDKYHYVECKAPEKPWNRRFRRIAKWFNSELTYLYTLDEWYDFRLDDYIKHLSRKVKFDAVIVEYVFLSRAFNNFGPEVLKILDTHDIFANRHQRYLKQGQAPAWYSTTVASEAKGLSRANVVVAIQEDEKKYFSAVTSRKVITVGHITPVYPPLENIAQSNRILFVGSANPINMHAVSYFLKEVFPIVRKKLSQIEFVVVGGVCDKLDELPGLIKLGRVDNLKQVYQSVQCVVNPVLFGTGLKIKSIEALGYSKPLVTSPAGAEGLEDGSGKAFLVESTAQGFADAILRLMEDRDLAAVLALEAQTFVNNWNLKCVHELQSLLNSN